MAHRRKKKRSIDNSFSTMAALSIFGLAVTAMALALDPGAGQASAPRVVAETIAAPVVLKPLVKSGRLIVKKKPSRAPDAAKLAKSVAEVSYGDYVAILEKQLR